MQIKPFSSGEIKFRMYFDRTARRSEVGDVFVEDGQDIEHLVFQFVLE